MLGQLLKNKVQEHDTGVELLRNKFVSLKISTLVTRLQTRGLQQGLPSLRVSWMPSDNFPWDFPQATVPGFAF